MAGATVVIDFVVDEASAQKMVRDIEVAGGKAMAIHADVSQQDLVTLMFQQMFEAYDSIDILVNNAGIQHFIQFLLGKNCSALH